MVFSGFIERAKEYGVKRIIFDRDFKISTFIWLSLIVISGGCTQYLDYTCVKIYNPELVDILTDISISLISLILLGLSVLVAFTNEKFLSELKEIGIYQNIVFIFEYTFYLTASTAILGSIIISYSLGTISFYIFLIFFIYMIMSVFSLIGLIVEFSLKKARFELESN